MAISNKVIKMSVDLANAMFFASHKPFTQKVTPAKGVKRSHEYNERSKVTRQAMFGSTPRFHSKHGHSTNIPGSASYDPSKGSHIEGHGAQVYVPPGGRIF